LKKQGVSDARILSVLGPIDDEKVQRQLIEGTVKKFGRLDVLVSPLFICEYK
jgi:SOS response regulatory protein OraA/RecX